MEGSPEQDPTLVSFLPRQASGLSWGLCSGIFKSLCTFWVCVPFSKVIFSSFIFSYFITVFRGFHEFLNKGIYYITGV